MLAEMKAVKALDADGSGSIDLKELRRLYNPEVLAKAEGAVLWKEKW